MLIEAEIESQVRGICETVNSENNPLHYTRMTHKIVKYRTNVFFIDFSMKRGRNHDDTVTVRMLQTLYACAV